MPQNFLKQALSVLAGLVVGVFLASGWSLKSADTGRAGEIYVQFLPLVHMVDCIPGPPIEPDDLERDLAVEARINQIREGQGNSRLVHSQKLTQAALRHSNDMADNDFFSHTSSDGTSAGQRLNQACYDWQAYGELIAAGYRTASGVVDGWMNDPDPEYRGIILDSQFRDIGAGYAYNRASEYKHYWTVNFGRQATSLMTAAQPLHMCSYHFESGTRQVWVSLYTTQPCDQAGSWLWSKRE
jgi:uncharacterized protein YkwD